MVIVNNNKNRIDTLPFTGKSAELTIASYLAYLVREERVEQIHFLLAQYVAKSCLIPKNLGNIAKFLVDIQNKIAQRQKCLRNYRLS